VAAQEPVTHGGKGMSSYRADQVGSLLRPPVLLRAREAHANGELVAEALREVEDRAINEALEMQRRVGIDVVSDGEFRRAAYMTDLAEAVDGFLSVNVEVAWRGSSEGPPTSAAQVVAAPLHQRRRLTAHESSFLARQAGSAFKVTVPSPVVFAVLSYQAGLSEKAYPTRAAFLEALVPIIRNELQALLDEGVPYVQLDAPRYSHFLDEQLREGLRQRGDDPDTMFEQALAADRACLTGLERHGATIGMHVCRGNSRGRWMAEGGYDRIAEQVFALPVDRFLLEYDSERAGGFEPLRFMPKDRTVVLGLITTKSPQLESPDAILRRIDEAATYVPIERLALSPQCGFASSAGGNPLTADDQRRKLELVAEVARRVWD
jgi:5-methyltetrahydropteroyltriglutamate--homocysteine methyltransferase